MLKRRLYIATIAATVGLGGIVSACATSGLLVDLDASTGDDSATTPDSGGTKDSGPATDAGCNQGETKCGSACKSLGMDPQNCGQCGTVCAGGTACEQGSCHLACSPQTRCLVGDAGPDSGVETCIDTKTNQDHCGACNAACPSAQFCDAGTCDLGCDAGVKCAVPDAGLSCIDTQTSNAHCGACNAPCTSGKVCITGTCQIPVSTNVEIFPPTGNLVDPGGATVWGGRYYTMTFAQQQTLAGLEWRANLASNESIRAEGGDPQTMTKLATGTAVSGANVQAFYKSTISFTLLANKAYVVGVYIGNANTIFPRKDSPTYPFTVVGPFGNITVSACSSTSTGNTDIFPASTNSWGPDFKLYLQ
ncbi:hypothetical protein BH09MYX1_BH09MYX1_57320 [soil metagenome]